MRKVSAVALAMTIVVVGCGDGTGGPLARVEPRPDERGVSLDPSKVHRLALSWSNGLLGGPGGIAADRDGVVVSVDNDEVVAIDVHGDQRWSTPVPGAGLGWPSLADDLVVVPTHRDELGQRGGCVALDRESGALAWVYEEPASEGVAVTRAGGNVICALGDGVVVAIDPRTGRRRWRAVLAERTEYEVSIAYRTSIAVDDSTGVIGFTASFGPNWLTPLLDIETGGNRGFFDFRRVGPPSAPVALSPGLFAIGLSKSREVCELDLKRRRVGRCVAAPVPLGFDPASIPLVADGLVVIAARDGSVTAVDLAKRNVRWSVLGPTPILSARPVVENGIVMFNDWTRVAWAVHLSDGAPVQIPEFDGWVIAIVADADGGFEIAKRNMDGGWLERWVPT